MKTLIGRNLFVILTVLILITSLTAIIYADEVNNNLPQNTRGTFYKNIENNKTPTIEEANTAAVAQKSRLFSIQSAPNHINIRSPETQGYYYITDYMFIEIDTAYPSTCTASLNGGPAESMVDNETYHYKSFPGLVDNMESEEPYVVEFSCDDGSGEAATNYTYFWINTSYLDIGLLRNDFDDWTYKNSEYIWLKDEGFEGYYYSYYYKENKNELINEVDVLVFDSEESLQKGVKKYFIEYYGDNLSLQTINNKNFYVFNGKYVKMVAWKSGNYFIGDWTFRYNDSAPTNFKIPDEILNPYLEKYPNDLRYGTCGDGKTDVLNLLGQKEECDKNSQTASCGSNVGECRQGIKTRKCNLNCTWGNFGACNDTKPKAEICDLKDNNCDGKTDETFPLLGQTCSSGLGVCQESGKYVCSSSLLNVTCSAITKTPQKENCNDKIDNDCDGKTDFLDTKDCIILRINSPTEKAVYHSKNVLLDIYSDITPNDIVYSYSDKNGKKVSVKLCSKCNNFNKTKSFNDGNYNITIWVMNKSMVLTNKTISFLIDSTKPKISKTLPKAGGLSNGNFTIEFSEINPKSPVLYYDKYNKTLNLNTDCYTLKDTHICGIKVNLSSFNGRDINYSFNLTDISENHIGTKPVRVTIDSVFPQINNPTSFWKKDPKYPQNINFNLSINEENFGSVAYIDSFDGTKAKWISLCNKLSKNNECVAKKTFKKGIHSLKIRIIDKAGNYIEREIKFEIDN